MTKNKTLQPIIDRLIVTVTILLLIRFGTFLPVPGINQSDLEFYIQSHSVTKSLVSAFSGGDTFVIGLFTLNIFPYINASIFVQLLIGFSPELSKLQKEGDLEGRRSINRLTRLITLGWAILQSVSVATYLKQILFDWNLLLALEIVVWLTTGAMIILWLSEFITDYGLGNGASLFIYTNIISNLPNISKIIAPESTVVEKLLLALLLLSALFGIVFLQEGTRRIPLISAKQLNQNPSGDPQAGVRSKSYIPIRFNQAGVMPIILTSALLILPNYLSTIGVLPKLELPFLSGIFSILYWVGYFLLILIFSSFYSTLVINPKDMSDQLQKMAVAIPGIRPGIQTTFHLKRVMRRTTLIGAIALATLATIPTCIESSLNITNVSGLSSTSLLILAGVVLDLTREVKSLYFSNVYNKMYQ